ncbi:hypothetical protein HMI55_005420 [Coelomomyces lativittatus]|nr:hypothetical protein HMI55_005420 [Coelomomyces lativittatus]
MTIFFFFFVLLLSYLFWDVFLLQLKLFSALDLSIVELRSLFKHEDLAKSFQQLVENPPTLLMRTMLSALQVHPSLTSFMKTMLIKLTTKHQVWQHKTLWEGFLRVFQKTLPKSVTVIFNLPPLQVHEVLHRVHGAKACVLEFIDSKQLHKQPRVMALATVLGLQEETNGGGGNENGSFTSPSSSSSSSSVSSSTSYTPLCFLINLVS